MVLAEHHGGQVTDGTYELIALGRAVAGALGGRVTAVLPGGGVADMAGQLAGADRVLAISHPRLEQFTPGDWTAAAAAAARSAAPDLILLANTSQGMDVAPALAAALDRPLVAYCKHVAVEGGAVVATANILGGKIMAEVALDGPAVLTVLPGAAPADAGRTGGAGTVEQFPAPDLGPGRVRFRRLIAPEAGDVDITRTDVLVSVGRGIGDAGNIPLAEELADALGGAVSASRPIIDNGWLPKSRQVGKSGQTVKPRCYIACGISGAPEHLEGMRDAALVIALNTDERAPIFDVAHYGATADILDLLPELTERLRAR